MLEIIIYTVLSLVFLLIGLTSFYKIFIQKVNPFFRLEADRALNNNFEESKGWSSEGRVYTQGLSITKNKNNEIQITPQSKLADSGLLFN